MRHASRPLIGWLARLQATRHAAAGAGVSPFVPDMLHKAGTHPSLQHCRTALWSTVMSHIHEQHYSMQQVTACVVAHHQQQKQHLLMSQQQPAQSASSPESKHGQQHPDHNQQPQRGKQQEPQQDKPTQQEQQRQNHPEQQQQQPSASSDAHSASASASGATSDHKAPDEETPDPDQDHDEGAGDPMDDIEFFAVTQRRGLMLEQYSRQSLSDGMHDATHSILLARQGALARLLHSGAAFVLRPIRALTQLGTVRLLRRTVEADFHVDEFLEGARGAVQQVMQLYGSKVGGRWLWMRGVGVDTWESRRQLRARWVTMNVSVVRRLPGAAAPTGCRAAQERRPCRPCSDLRSRRCLHCPRGGQQQMQGLQKRHPPSLRASSRG